MNISEFCKIYTGTGFPIEFQGKKNGKYPFYKVSDISVSNTQQKIFLDNANNYIDEFDLSILKGNLIPAGTIVFAKIGEALKLNKRAITSCECLIDNNVIGIKPDDNIINLLYFYYYLLKIDMLHYSESTTLPSVRKSTIEKIKVKIPPIDVQNKRVTILNICHKIIKVQVELIHNLDLLVKSRFDEFNKNNNNVKVLKLEALCTSIVRGPFGSALKVENFVKKSDTSVKVYEQSNAIQRSAAIGSRYISREHYESLRRFKCKPGDIIMSCSGTIGKLFILPNDAEEGIINQALCKFTLGKELLPEVFLLYMDILIGNIEIKGSGIKNISAVKFIKNLEIPVPPIGIQSKLLFELNQINKLKSDVQKSIDETQLLMDSLMQEYFG